jgi:glucose/arabinose dehydrogenase
MRLFRVLIALALAACPPPPNHTDGGSGGGSAGGGSATGGGSAAGGGHVGGGSGGGAQGGGGTILPPRPDGGWCEQPGAWVHDLDGGFHSVSGLSGHDLSWITPPPGYCLRWFGHVGNCRQIRFAPSGELFVASPTQGTTSGGPQGQASIFVLPDDNNDGLADSNMQWRGGLPSTQGMLFVDGGFYYQDGTQIMLEPYTPGDRAPKGTAAPVADISVANGWYASGGHWPKTLDIAEDGTVFVSNGGDEGEACDLTRPMHGGIFALDSTGTGGVRPIAKGLRNPIYVRCHHDGHNHCFADELARDYSTNVGGREKLLPIHEGDDWGFSCCAAENLPYSDICETCGGAGVAPMASSSSMCQGFGQCSPLCTGIQPESASFLIGDTPFGLEFIDSQFPPPWDHHVFIAPHGAFATWVGARVVGVAIDTSTGLPPPGDAGVKADFLTGWDDNHLNPAHGRPTDLTVSADGRLFLSNDTSGDIVWIAPTGP